MDKELPSKITPIDILRINRKAQKACQCVAPSCEVDVQNRLATCQTCGVIVDPFEAIKRLALYWELYNMRMEGALEQAKVISTYKPHLRVIKSIETNYRTMNPVCPLCERTFDLKDINTWAHKRFTERRDKDDGHL